MTRDELVAQAGGVIVAVLLTAGCAAATTSRPSAASPPAQPTPTAGATSLPAVPPNDAYAPEGAAVDAAKPGEILVTTPLHDYNGAAVYVVVYASSGLDGEGVPVSGLVMVPARDPPVDGWPILAWAHGTTGSADECAPSRSGLLGIDRQILDLTTEGYVLTATDYAGLGTAGPLPYLVGLSAGRSVLDSIRAAQNLTDAAGRRAAIFGHSEGAHATLWAAELAPAYAPELDISGALAASAAVDLRAVNDRIYRLATTGDTEPAIPALRAYGAWSALYGLPLDFLSDEGRAIAQAENMSCEDYTSEASPYLQDPSEIPEWLDRLRENSLGASHTAIPIRVVLPSDDPLSSRPKDALAVLCGAGDAVDVEAVPGGHEDSMWAGDAFAAATAWLQDRLAGVPFESEC